MLWPHQALRVSSALSILQARDLSQVYCAVIRSQSFSHLSPLPLPLPTANSATTQASYTHQNSLEKAKDSGTRRVGVGRV